MENDLNVRMTQDSRAKTLVIEAPSHGLTAFGAALTIISTIVGGGIVGFPFALYNVSVILSLVLITIMALQLVGSVNLYLRIKDILPGQPTSLFEMGFVLYKRASIFFISAILIFNSFGLMLVYFILFGDTLSSLAMNLSSSLTPDDFWGKRAAYVGLLALLLLPLILKKELNELRVMSMTLFLAVIVFIIILIIQLIFDGVHKFNPDFPEGSDFQFFYSDYYKPKFDSVNMLKGINIFFVGFACQQNLWPIFNELKRKTNEECVKGFGLATVMVASLYLLLAFVGLYMFGHAVQSSILYNIADQCKGDECPTISIILRFIFMIVLACHIPFIFFSGKEGMLIVIDELDRKTISTALEQKVAYLNQKNQEERIDGSVNQKDFDISVESEHFRKSNVRAETMVSHNMHAHKTSSLKPDTTGSSSDNVVMQSHNTMGRGTNMQTSQIKLSKSTLRSIQRPTQNLVHMVKNSMVHKDEDPAVKFSGHQVRVEEGEEFGGDYKSMNACYYYTSTILMFALEAYISVLVDDVTSVFDFISAICVSALGMFFPAIFFLKAYGRLSDQEKEGQGRYKCLAYFNFCIGLVAFAAGIMSNVVSIIEGGE